MKRKIVLPEQGQKRFQLPNGIHYGIATYLQASKKTLYFSGRQPKCPITEVDKEVVYKHNGIQYSY